MVRLHRTFLLLLHIFFFGNTKVQTHPNLQNHTTPHTQNRRPEGSGNPFWNLNSLSSKTFHSVALKTETAVSQHGQHSRDGYDPIFPLTSPRFKPRQLQKFPSLFLPRPPDPHIMASTPSRKSSTRSHHHQSKHSHIHPNTH